ncbi:MAG TPA: type II secretion system protein [candidate division CPR3 bacterium]|uniref:Type II secretion system protein n=1 Tax=candidate division CPR3 bacterium TaxID=2268181 RepID=A0A7C1T7E9_UNCC3|nr:type II secretion system protein [candidate division CPR3 bacterium]
MKKGFTIPELLVAIALFGLITGAAVNLLVSAIDAQRRSLVGQNIVSQSSFTMEYMTRALRQAQKEMADPPGGCLLQGRGYNYEATATGDGGIRFINAQGACQEFYLESGRVKEIIDAGSPENLTSDNFTVTQFSFQLLGESQADLLQPRLTLVFALESASAVQFGLRLQTTISQRNIDIVR